MGPYIFAIPIRVELNMVVNQKYGSIEVEKTKQKGEKKEEQKDSVHFLSLPNGTNKTFRISKEDNEDDDSFYMGSELICKVYKRE